MSKIKILSENLANQIAAGEVIERPASVVKEFVENAIDADSRNISVQIEGGVTGLIRIIDDGCGMDQDDMLLCLERHATSKLKSIEELGAIRTLGFRGEAVPSIASVAKLTITSRLADHPLGNQVDVRFGKVIKVHEMGCGQGTVMEVRDLFGNVPARRKFLKSTQTELSHIEEVIKSYCLARHDLGFSYHVGGREILRLPAGIDDRSARVGRILRKKVADLITFSAGSSPVEDDGIKLEGFLLPPDSPGSGGGLRILVNGRTVRDRMLGHAVAEGMQGFLMKGRSPAGVLYLELNPATIDVNVHPAKQEIRFHRAKVVHQFVALTVAEAIRNQQGQIKAAIFGRSTTATPAAGYTRPQADFAPRWTQASLLKSSLNEPVVAYVPEKKSILAPHGQKVCATIVASAPPGSDVEQDPAAKPRPDKDSPDAAATNRGSRPEPQSVNTAPLSAIRIIGQFGGTYILCEVDDALVAIDQHAAQERLIYEKLKQQYAARRVKRQGLLFPKIVELGPVEQEIVAGHGEELVALGFELEEFGGTSLVIKAMPAMLSHLEPEEQVFEVISRLGQRSGNPGVGADAIKGGADGPVEAILASMACKAAVKAGDRLEPVEMEALIRQILGAEVFSHCPHGRPVVKMFAAAEVRKWFHRT